MILLNVYDHFITIIIQLQGGVGSESLCLEVKVRKGVSSTSKGPDQVILYNIFSVTVIIL